MTRPSARHPLDLFEGRKKELRRTRRRKEYGQRSVGFLIPPLQGEGPARTGPREARPDDRLRAGGGVELPQRKPPPPPPPSPPRAAPPPPRAGGGKININERKNNTGH